MSEPTPPLRPTITRQAQPQHLAERLTGFTVRRRRLIPDLTANEALFLRVELELDAAERPDADPDALRARLETLRG